MRSLFAKIFAAIAFKILFLKKWKWNVVQANADFVKGVDMGGSEIRPEILYPKLLRNLARHAGELLFSFGTFKKLPKNLSEYPSEIARRKFSIAEDSIPVLEKMKQGGIFLTAHYGNYEAMGPWLCRLGSPLVASYIPVKPKWLNRILEGRIRAVDGRSYSINAQSPREFLRLLDERKLFCLLDDQDSRIESATAEKFLGRDVHNNPLPEFLLKHRPETPVFICWIAESASNAELHAIELHRNANSISNQFNCWLEARIKENPALWYGWTHRRFYSVNPDIYR